MRKFLYIFIVLLIVVIVIVYLVRIKQGKIATDNLPANNIYKQENVMPEPTPINPVSRSLPKPTMEIDQAKTYYAVLHFQEGNIKVELDVKNTPITANNFVYLAKNDFYNNTTLHRIIKGFMIQGGDPLGTGTGDPGYKFDDEPINGEYTRGTLAMANSGPNTNGSQFFIMHQDNPLPKNYVIFGKTVDGLQVLDKIADAPVKRNVMGELSSPVSKIILSSVEIIEETVEEPSL